MARKYKIITPDDRRAIERAYLGGATVDEIAAEVGVARSTIYREIARGYTGAVDENGRPAYSAATAQRAAVASVSNRGRPFAR